MPEAPNFVTLTWASDDRLFARQAPEPPLLAQRMALIPPEVHRGFDEAVRLANQAQLEPALHAYARALDGVPAALRPVVPEMVLELDVGRAKCLIALGRPGEAAEVLGAHLGRGRALRHVICGMAIDVLGMLGECSAALGRTVQTEQCLNVMLSLAMGPGAAHRDLALDLRTRCLVQLAATAPPEEALGVLDPQQAFFGPPEADWQGSALRIEMLVKLGRLAAARALAEKRLAHLRAHAAPPALIDAGARDAAAIPPGPGLDANPSVLGARAQRRLDEGPVGEQLMQAGARGDLAALERLERSPFGLDASGSGSRTALHLAAFFGHAKAVRWLLDRGASLEATTADSRSALMLAADQGHAQAAALLLERGAQVDRQDGSLQTALHLAAWQDHRDTIEVLLAHGADLARCDVNGCNALHLTCTEDLPEAVSLLLSAGARLDQATPAGHTPLMLAAMEGRSAVVRVLLRAGARRDVRDGTGLTALDWARGQRHAQVAALLAD